MTETITVTIAFDTDQIKDNVNEYFGFDVFANPNVDFRAAIAEWAVDKEIRDLSLVTTVSRSE